MPNWKKVITSGSNAELNHITASGNIKTAQLQDTSLTSGRVTFATTDGVLTDSSILTFNGTKLSSTFLESVRSAVINEDGHVDGNLRVESSGNQNMLFVDAGEDRVGIGTGTPGEELEVVGNISASGDLNINAITASGNIIADGIKATLPAGVDNSVVILDADGFLKTDEVDEFIFTGAILKPTGADTFGSSHDGKFPFIDDGDTNVLDGDSNLKNVTGGIEVTGDLKTSSHITASGNISASGTQNVIPRIYGKSINDVTTNNISMITDNRIDLNPNNVTIVRLSDSLVTLNKDTLVNGHITASGNISASQSVITNELTASSFQFVGSGTAELEVQGNITASGNISASGNLISSRQFDKSGTSNNHLAQGDIIYQGGGSTTQGNIVYMKTDGEWGDAQADAASTATSLLGIALGTDPDVDGVLLRGTYTLDHDVGNNQGVPLYLSDGTAGQATVTAPSDDGDIIRIIGYNLGDDDEIWFDPDKTWVEHN